MKFNPEDLLQVFLDGSFTPEAQAEFDRLMSRDPLFAERVTKALAERLGPVPDPTVEAIAANLDGRIGGLWDKNKPSAISSFLGLAGKIALSLGAAGGLYFGLRYAAALWGHSPLYPMPGSIAQAPHAGTVEPLKKPRSVSFSISANGIKAVPPGIERNTRLNSRASGAAPTVSSPPPQGQAARALPTAPTGSNSIQAPGASSNAPSPATDLEGTSVQVDVENDKDQTVNVLIFDGQGLLVRRLFQGVMKAGEGSIPWDGKDDLGRTLRPGDYTVEVQMGGQSMSQTVAIQP